MKLFILFCIFICLNSLIVLGTGIDCPKEIDENTDVLVTNWDFLPFKNQMIGSQNRINYVNTNLNPIAGNWSRSPIAVAYKCSSYGASTTNDWFNLQYGAIMQNYVSYLNGVVEKGTNPRLLESMYYERAGGFLSESGVSTYSYTPFYSNELKGLYNYFCIYINKIGFGTCGLGYPDLEYDPVTKERITYNLKGYSKILKNPSGWINRQDQNIKGEPNYSYTLFEDYFNVGNYKELLFFTESDVRSELENNHILYTFTKEEGDLLNSHSVAIVGYMEHNGVTYFISHDNYGDNPFGRDKYQCLKINEIGIAYKFYPKPDWPTYHHDNRRTGFTLLKGDLESTSKKKGMNLVLAGNIEYDALARPSIANIDNKGNQEVIVSYGAGAFGNEGWIVALEKDKFLWHEYTDVKWVKEIGFPVSAPPSLGNIDEDEKLEIVVGLSNGTLIVLNHDGSDKWAYSVEPKPSVYLGQPARGDLAYTAIADIDLDGKAEIIFTDYEESLYDWKGELYIIEDNGDSYGSVHKKYLTSDGDGGAGGAPAIANIDDDDYSEIIIPGYYGIKVFDYDGSTITQKCPTNHGKIIGAPVLYDIDRDNEYEIIYTTADYNCAPDKNCFNKLYVIDANTCALEDSQEIDIFSLTAPAIANLDSDSNIEIVIQGRTEEYGDYDLIQAYEYNSGNIQFEWNYSSSGNLQMIDVAPNIADINGDGIYEIIVAEESDHILMLYGNNGTKYDEFNVGGLIGSSPVIGDLSGKGVAELAVKRSGSPLSIFTMLTGNNSKPELLGYKDITAIAGELININQSGLLSASDSDGDTLTFYYSNPFNESGLWQSTINDTGTYSILIEVSDGSLSDYQYIDLTIFNSITNSAYTFADSTTQKSLSYTQAENKTIHVRLPKNAQVIYSKIRIEGLAP